MLGSCHRGVFHLLRVWSILIPGSGPTVICHAAEVDYSGAQAVRALREEEYRNILVNGNRPRS